MSVREVTDDMYAEPNCVFTLSPGTTLDIFNGTLQPTTQALKSVRQPIDHFLRSLARDQAERAVAIVLSGTGSDGALGVKEIKASLGMVMVKRKRPRVTRGMPHSAIATHVVDYVLPIEQMPEQLMAYADALRRMRQGSGTHRCVRSTAWGASWCSPKQRRARFLEVQAFDARPPGRTARARPSASPHLTSI